ncbi:MAG: DUF362 domain-containing protein [Candidatus Omnitrophota bacterium]
MKSKVYFIPVKESEGIPAIADKVRILCQESGVFYFISKGDSVAVKMHFGEEGNTGFVRPEYCRVICEGISQRGARPFLSDTNTLYRGKRTNSKEHLALAIQHGFTGQATGVEVIIPDETRKENTVDIEINQKFIKKARLLRLFTDADAIVAVSHFKGHIMTGFGGGLKNLGMGCATREGKLMQHSDIAPVVYAQNCTGCAECEKVCPAGAIRMENHKSVISGLKCIGCASCIAACSFMAIDVPWESGGNTIQEKMVEYAFALLKAKKGRLAFFNFAVKITKECDCLAKDDPRVSSDIGILASDDPVSIDKASFDLVNQACGRDIFSELHPHRDARRQLDYAAKLGLGSLDYELIELRGN